jgi:hypothetical protein
MGMTYVLIIMGFAITGFTSKDSCMKAGQEAAPFIDNMLMRGNVNPEITRVVCVPMPAGGQVVGGGKEWALGPLSGQR